jgi:hypothetical protein
VGIFVQRDDRQQLNTVHQDLVRVLEEAVRRVPFDCIVVYGHRTVKEQQALYALGRTKRGARVTWLDGINKKSRHNYTPSLAIDVVPFSIVKTGEWRETPESLAQLSILGAMAETVAKEFSIEDFAWGGRWKKTKDMPHFELTRNH